MPLTPFVDVVGKAKIVEPAQYGPTASKVGIVCGVIFIVNVVVVAHSPVAGVNVYVVLEVLLIAGDHVPLIPFVDVVGKAGIVLP